jgi:hypothetical protein
MIEANVRQKIENLIRRARQLGSIPGGIARDSHEREGVISGQQSKQAKVASHVRNMATHALWDKFDREGVTTGRPKSWQGRLLEN